MALAVAHGPRLLGRAGVVLALSRYCPPAARAHGCRVARTAHRCHLHVMPRLFRSLVLLVAAALVASCAARAPVPASAAGSGTLVAVFAHPDDETIVAPALARAARDGAKVYLI